MYPKIWTPVVQPHQHNNTMPFVINRDIPETYEELKQAFIAECKERYENIERARDLLAEEGQRITELETECEALQKSAIVLGMKNNELKGENIVLHNRVCQEETANMLLRNENKKLKKYE